MTSSTGTILVTGANGYIASHVVKVLLDNGYNVRGTVRSDKAAAQLRETFPGFIDKHLSIAFVADLSNSDEFANVIDSSIVGVVHTASPAAYPVEDIVGEILEPAIRSSVGVLDAVKRFADLQRFKRVVHLSSLAAMLDHSKGKRPGYVYSEDDWNPVTWEQAKGMPNYLDAYEASKALSERAVWKWMEGNQPWFDITCLCPSLVLGPHVERIDRLSEVRSTLRFLWMSLIGSDRIPSLDYGGFTDVRDLASMMVVALEAPAVSGKRFLVARHFDWQTAADILRAHFPALRDRIPEGMPGTGVESAGSSIYSVDGQRIVEVTQISYRPMSETLVDSTRQLLDIESREQSN
ncbi:ketoreductase [Boeremia exigua]|uniref:ketoreductase n=1 Tax=Boeremia exigua TaxID=749465 RepID=UPI001E8DBA2E|nr:ketoreductase [Boeremia exigua]KAH6620178.1 ketoreductase [Boeremia exigua]